MNTVTFTVSDNRVLIIENGQAQSFALNELQFFKDSSFAFSVFYRDNRFLQPTFYRSFNYEQVVTPASTDIDDLLTQLEALSIVQSGGGGGGVAQNYSTSEIALLNSDGTPLLWVDGKQVYQRSLVGFGYTLSDVSYLVSVFGVAMSSFSSGAIRDAVGSSELSGFKCELDVSINVLTVLSTTFGDVFVTVQYTKI